ncbi:hypothetical protein [Nostoc sp. NMS8]|uniref:hypothetical protein n=1 Tax=Nostoc sp. NMS8 TaxID=2815392 RepID=UPI0025E996A5|nr:hypothetical protein [Nostoc sp. NMS8]MBN3958433.1 hypothetical protein [Nostoc sp. NMS8]
MTNDSMALRKAERIVSPRSQSEDWECIPRGRASVQSTGGGASQNQSVQGLCLNLVPFD